MINYQLIYQLNKYANNFSFSFSYILLFFFFICLFSLSYVGIFQIQGHKCTIIDKMNQLSLITNILNTKNSLYVFLFLFLSLCLFQFYSLNLYSSINRQEFSCFFPHNSCHFLNHIFQYFVSSFPFPFFISNIYTEISFTLPLLHFHSLFIVVVFDSTNIV